MLELLPSWGVQYDSQSLNSHEFLHAAVLVCLFDCSEEIYRATLVEGQTILELLIGVFATVGLRFDILNFGGFQFNGVAVLIFGHDLNLGLGSDF